MKENHLICDDCTSLDEKVLKKCLRCAEKFCVHNSSEVSLDYCFNCMQDVNLKVTNVVREVKRVNPTTGKITVVPIKVATEYQFDGSDWLYMVQRIRDFASDPNGDFKFTKMIEYHKALYSLMISYREDTRQARMDKLRAEGGVVKLPATNGATEKIISATIHTPEATAMKKVGAILKITLGREPTPIELAQAVKALGFNV